MRKFLLVLALCALGAFIGYTIPVNAAVTPPAPGAHYMQYAQHPWYNAEGGYRWGQYGATSEGEVYLSGLIRNINAIGAGHCEGITTLPTAYRPDHRLVFAVATNVRSGYVEVRPLGGVVYCAQVKGTGWVSLSGISYLPNGATS